MTAGIAVAGHAWRHCLSHAENGEYIEYDLPGGAAMVAAILSGDALPARSLKKPAVRHTRLKRGKADGSGWFVDRHDGWTRGDTLIAPPTEGDTVVLWDEGFGGIEVPDDQRPILWASNQVIPNAKIIGAIRDRAFIMLDADVLRRAGVMISRQVSWERTATDFVWQVANNSTIAHLRDARFLLVTFAEDGAICFDVDGTPTLCLSHGEEEGSLRDNGEVPDVWAVMVARAATAFHELAGRPDFSYSMAASVPQMVFGAQQLARHGYDLEVLRGGDLRGLLGDGWPPGAGSVEEVPVSRQGGEADPNYWRLADFAWTSVFGAAFEYAKFGVGAVLELPRLTLGGLTTVDRQEIEAFQNVKNLILEYVASTTTRPLCLAVFGAPGSGKSFGVTEIAQSVLPGGVDRLAFNVSQFSGVNDLTAAFQKIRDSALTGKLPLVFFDEFDSDRDGRPLGWLKSFLMPMQDGLYRDATDYHPIGRCVLVFGGGTKATLQEFVWPLGLDPRSTEEETRSSVQEFRSAKAPDFVSRLRGTVDVVGPNRQGAQDTAYLLRRAVLLRSICRRRLTTWDHREPVLPVNDDIVRAMLLVPAYKHGARSMEAVLDMSRIRGSSLEPADLPSEAQLRLHVDAQAFFRLLLVETLFGSVAEDIAQEIYEQESYPESVLMRRLARPWAELAQEHRDFFLARARHIPMQLAEVECGFDVRQWCADPDTSFPTVNAFSEEEIARLARMEHERRRRERSDSGWPLEEGDMDPVAKALTSIEMVPWEGLGSDVQDRYRHDAEQIIHLLDAVGLRIYRIT